ncbi:14814_t:CDS:2 [Funneliformis caledonium]|uniref:14814_t:CDS:1 n=1 Tax=Funneliformis caledonium TaxID=1117310 RepID=A0A9N8V027_9GLOM|nr:14814_t:CDS:2 [Funneliformis caledonium]
MSEDVNTFWLSIDMKKQIDVKKLKRIENALDAKMKHITVYYDR